MALNTNYCIFLYERNIDPLRSPSSRISPSLTDFLFDSATPLISKHNDFMETRGCVSKSNKLNKNCPHKLQYVAIRKTLTYVGPY